MIMIYLIAFLLIPFTAILNGWAFSLMWGWFVVPQFGAAPLRIPIAIGIAAVVRFLTWQISTKKNEAEEDVAKSIAVAIVTPLFFLLFGWVVHLFV